MPGCSTISADSVGTPPEPLWSCYPSLSDLIAYHIILVSSASSLLGMLLSLLFLAISLCLSSKRPTASRTLTDCSPPKSLCVLCGFAGLPFSRELVPLSKSPAVLVSSAGLPEQPPSTLHAAKSLPAVCLLLTCNHTLDFPFLYLQKSNGMLQNELTNSCPVSFLAESRKGPSRLLCSVF